MWLTILGLLQALFGAAGKLFGWLSQRDLMQAGAASNEASSLSKQVEAAHDADKVRQEADANWAASSDAERMSDDGFSRD